MPGMESISVVHAEKVILKKSQPLRLRLKPTARAYGQILAENIFADRDQPASDRSAMDGIAISFKAWQKGSRSFSLEGIQKAGIAAKKLQNPQGCFEIMTGAVMPSGCDCVVPIESVTLNQKHAAINDGLKVFRFQFVRQQGREYKKGVLLLTPGTLINASHISVAASVGRSMVKVFSPKIAVIGTGDELLAIRKTVKTHQARRSNAVALETLLRSNGFTDVKEFHFNDNVAILKKNLKKILAHYDVLVLSGGVSMGQFDFIPQVLKSLDVKVLFHKVNQKPGKPFWFGVNNQGKPVFALPGNPVSTLVCAARYVLPYLQKSAGLKNISQTMVLDKSVRQNSALTLFIPVRLQKSRVCPYFLGSSGDYNSLTKSDGFIEIPQGRGLIKKGQHVRFFKW